MTDVSVIVILIHSSVFILTMDHMTRCYWKGSLILMNQGNYCRAAFTCDITICIHSQYACQQRSPNPLIDKPTVHCLFQTGSVTGVRMVNIVYGAYMETFLRNLLET